MVTVRARSLSAAHESDAVGDGGVGAKRAVRLAREVCRRGGGRGRRAEAEERMECLLSSPAQALLLVGGRGGGWWWWLGGVCSQLGQRTNSGRAQRRVFVGSFEPALLQIGGVTVAACDNNLSFELS